MRCRSVLTRVDALRTGQLPAEEQGTPHEHLNPCPSCADPLTDVGQPLAQIKAIAPVPPRSCKDELADSYDRLQFNREDVWVAFSDKGIRFVLRGSFDTFSAAYAKRHGRCLKSGTLPEALRKQVESAIEGGGVDKPRVDWSGEFTDLERDVLGVLPKIPRGEVRTYEWVARQVGRPRAVRAVGNILARNAVPLVVPCHRVVPTAGGIGNYAFGSAMKRELLRREGVDVDGLEQLARSGVRYVGSRTTKIVCFPTCRDARRIREENRVPFRGADQAKEKGFRRCLHCQPFAA